MGSRVRSGFRFSSKTRAQDKSMRGGEDRYRVCVGGGVVFANFFMPVQTSALPFYMGSVTAANPQFWGASNDPSLRE